MLEGIIWAVGAGIMLGLYALPEKFTKGFEFENTWGLMFFINMLIVPVLACVLLIDHFGEVLGAISGEIWLSMGIAGILWGIGVMMWGRAINFIGLSLGFSIFIGTVILIGSLLPFWVDGLPPVNAFVTILLGILIVLSGVIANGRAGIIREQSEKSSAESPVNKGHMARGILIAIVGGILATGFSYANAAGRPVIHAACQAQGNPEWVTAIAVMFVIYVAGSLFVIPYFVFNLNTKRLWKKFKTPHMGQNTLLTAAMAMLNFGASAGFAYAAYKLGQTGNTVGYAIFNTISVAVAIISGLLTGEWTNAVPKAKGFMYAGLAAMIIGVIVIAVGNSLG